jgi:diguanylate cyclase (GGDEF)-like protein/PAS domain S-box-containing protein
MNKLEISSHEIYITDAETFKLVYANSAARRNLGFSDETLFSLRLMDILPEFTVSDFQKSIEPLIARESEHVVLSTLQRRADASSNPVDLYLHPIFLNVGVYILAAVKVTNSAEEEFQNEDLFRSLLGNSRDNISLLSPEGILLWESPSRRETLGYEQGHFFGRNIFEIMHPDDVEWTSALYKEALMEPGGSREGIFRLLHRNGTWRWIEANVTNLLHESSVRAVVINYRDVTDRKLLEEAEREQRILAEALRDTSAALNSTLKLHEVLDRVLENLEKVVQFDAAMILQVDGLSIQKLRHHNKYVMELHQGNTGNTQPTLLNTPILRELLETKKTLLISDIQKDPRWNNASGLGWVRSMVSAPVVIQGRVENIINLISAIPDFFTQKHLDGIKAFADQAAIAIANAKLFEKVHYLSITDSLTDLYSRRYFFELAQFEIERSKRYKDAVCAMMVDIDHFKSINDDYGHAFGDEVIREIALRIKRSLRTIDIVARYGGEEFVILMPNTMLLEAAQVAERVREFVAGIPIIINSIQIQSTLSIGVAELDGENPDLDQLIADADQALYNSKRAGRNQVAFFKK